MNANEEEPSSTSPTTQVVCAYDLDAKWQQTEKALVEVIQEDDEDALEALEVIAADLVQRADRAISEHRGIPLDLHVSSTLSFFTILLRRFNFSRIRQSLEPCVRSCLTSEGSKHPLLHLILGGPHDPTHWQEEANDPITQLLRIVPRLQAWIDSSRTSSSLRRPSKRKRRCHDTDWNTEWKVPFGYIVVHVVCHAFQERTLSWVKDIVPTFDALLSEAFPHLLPADRRAGLALYALDVLDSSNGGDTTTMLVHGRRVVVTDLTSTGVVTMLLESDVLYLLQSSARLPRHALVAKCTKVVLEYSYRCSNADRATTAKVAARVLLTRGAGQSACGYMESLHTPTPISTDAVGPPWNNNRKRKSTSNEPLPRAMLLSEEEDDQEYGLHSSPTPTTLLLREEIASPGYPLLVHIEVLLNSNNVDSAIAVAERMESSRSLVLARDEQTQAWWLILEYLRDSANLFLDGHNSHSPSYQAKRQRLLSLHSQMGNVGRHVILGYYQKLVEFVQDDPNATAPEMEYVTKAAQQTVLRLMINKYGTKRGIQYMKETFPSASFWIGNLEQWAIQFLRSSVTVPPTLLVDGQADLNVILDRTPCEVEEEEIIEAIETEAPLAVEEEEEVSLPGTHPTADEERVDIVDDSSNGEPEETLVETSFEQVDSDSMPPPPNVQIPHRQAYVASSAGSEEAILLDSDDEEMDEEPLETNEETNEEEQQHEDAHYAQDDAYYAEEEDEVVYSDEADKEEVHDEDSYDEHDEGSDDEHIPDDSNSTEEEAVEKSHEICDEKVYEPDTDTGYGYTGESISEAIHSEVEDDDYERGERGERGESDESGAGGDNGGFYDDAQALSRSVYSDDMDEADELTASEVEVHDEESAQGEDLYIATEQQKQEQDSAAALIAVAMSTQKPAEEKVSSDYNEESSSPITVGMLPKLEAASVGETNTNIANSEAGQILSDYFHETTAEESPRSESIVVGESPDADSENATRNHREDSDDKSVHGEEQLENGMLYEGTFNDIPAQDDLDEAAAVVEAAHARAVKDATTADFETNDGTFLNPSGNHSLSLPGGDIDESKSINNEDSATPPNAIISNFIDGEQILEGSLKDSHESDEASNTPMETEDIVESSNAVGSDSLEEDIESEGSPEDSDNDCIAALNTTMDEKESIDPSCSVGDEALEFEQIQEESPEKDVDMPVTASNDESTEVSTVVASTFSEIGVAQEGSSQGDDTVSIHEEEGSLKDSHESDEASNTPMETEDIVESSIAVGSDSSEGDIESEGSPEDSDNDCIAASNTAMDEKESIDPSCSVGDEAMEFEQIQEESPEKDVDMPVTASNDESAEVSTVVASTFSEIGVAQEGSPQDDDTVSTHQEESLSIELRDSPKGESTVVANFEDDNNNQGDESHESGSVSEAPISIRRSRRKRATPQHNEDFIYSGNPSKIRSGSPDSSATSRPEEMSTEKEYSIINNVKETPLSDVEETIDSLDTIHETISVADKKENAQPSKKKKDAIVKSQKKKVEPPKRKSRRGTSAAKENNEKTKEEDKRVTKDEESDDESVRKHGNSSDASEDADEVLSETEEDEQNSKRVAAKEDDNEDEDKEPNKNNRLRGTKGKRKPKAASPPKKRPTRTSSRRKPETNLNDGSDASEDEGRDEVFPEAEHGEENSRVTRGSRSTSKRPRVIAKQDDDEGQEPENNTRPSRKTRSAKSLPVLSPKKRQTRTSSRRKPETNSNSVKERKAPAVDENDTVKRTTKKKAQSTKAKKNAEESSVSTRATTRSSTRLKKKAMLKRLE